MVALIGWPLRATLVRMAKALIPLPDLPAIALMAALAAFAGAGSAWADTEVAGAVVVIDGLPADGALEAARDQVPARWRLEPLHPQQPPPVTPHAEVALLSRAYLNADFLHCLTELQRPSLDVERLLE